MKNKRSLTDWLLIALLGGIALGLCFHRFFPADFNEFLIKWLFKPIGELFFRSMKMLVVPLVLCSLVSGVSAIGDTKKLGRVSGKIVAYYLLTTLLAVIIALIFANIINPGHGVSLALPGNYAGASVPFIMDVLVNMIPQNPIEALVRGDVLQILIFAVLFGMGIILLGAPARSLLNVFTQANDVMMKLVGFLMKLAPWGIFALVIQVFMLQGIEVLLPLLKYALTILLALLFQLLLVYGAALKLLGKVNPLKFFKKFMTPMIMAFGTASSNALIPVTLKSCQKDLGAPEGLCSLTIPLGAAIHMDGTAIMQGAAAVFIAQVFGIELTFVQQLLIILAAVLASVATAGVPGAGLLMLSMVLQQVGLPLEGIALILPVDRLLDMARTVVNVTGDAVGTVIVANSEKELDLGIYNS